jgi:hypothetical protein
MPASTALLILSQRIERQLAEVGGFLAEGLVDVRQSLDTSRRPSVRVGASRFPRRASLLLAAAAFVRPALRSRLIAVALQRAGGGVRRWLRLAAWPRGACTIASRAFWNPVLTPSSPRCRAEFPTTASAASVACSCQGLRASRRVAATYPCAAAASALEGIADLRQVASPVRGRRRSRRRPSAPN